MGGSQYMRGMEPVLGDLGGIWGGILETECWFDAKRVMVLGCFCTGLFQSEIGG